MELWYGIFNIDLFSVYLSIDTLINYCNWLGGFFAPEVTKNLWSPSMFLIAYILIYIKGTHYGSPSLAIEES